MTHDWNRGKGAPEPSMTPPELDDETLRDGLQSPSALQPPLDEKIRFLHILADIGIQAADIGLPAAGARTEEEVTELAREISTNRLPIVPNCAARTLEGDVEAVIRAAESSGQEIEAAIFLGSSPIRSEVERWDLESLLRMTRESVGLAVRNGLPVMFVTEDSTRSHPRILDAVYSEALEAGAGRLCIADTAGASTPEGAARIVAFLRGVLEKRGARNIRLDWHGHMDRGLGLACALSAVGAGIDRLHGSGLGVGERVGNVPMDLLIVNLKLAGLWEGALVPLKDYVRWVSKQTGTPIPRRYPAFGSDAYRTATGVHASAIRKAMKREDPELTGLMYSSVSASWFGFRQMVEVGPMSGRSNVLCWLESRGIQETTDLVESILGSAKEARRTLTEEEILEIVRRAQAGKGRPT